MNDDLEAVNIKIVTHASAQWALRKPTLFAAYFLLQPNVTFTEKMLVSLNKL